MLALISSRQGRSIQQSIRTDCMVFLDVAIVLFLNPASKSVLIEKLSFLSVLICLL